MSDPATALLAAKTAPSLGLVGGVPIVIIVLAVCAAMANKKDRSRMTPARQKVFEDLMRDCMDPAKLNECADVFEGEGLKEPYGDLLRKRAALRSLPDSVRKERRKIMRWALTLKDPAKIETIADEFQEMTCMGIAVQLREYAKGLRAQPSVNHEDYQPSETEAAGATP
jgi:hypothetical protein